MNSTSWQVSGEIVPRVETERKVVALTFDDGPIEERVDAVLPVLAASRVRATFFVTGAALAERMDLGRRLVAGGHELGNHSYSHMRMIFIRRSTVAREIESTDALIREAGHRGPIHFRPPYGKKLVELPLYLRRARRVSVTWDIVADSEPVTDVVARVRPGSIILLHVMGPVPGIVDGLRRRGFEFVTISELLAFRD